MNSIKLKVLLVVAVCFSFCVAASFAETANVKREVGEFDSTGKLVLHRHALKKEFSNGTWVDQFKTFTLEGKLYLERSGVDKHGNYVREAVPLNYDKKADLPGEPAYLQLNTIIERTLCKRYDCECALNPAAVANLMTQEIDARCKFLDKKKKCACRFKKATMRVESKSSRELETKVSWSGKPDITYRELSTDAPIISYGHGGDGIEPYVFTLCESDNKNNKLKLDDWVIGDTAGTYPGDGIDPR